MMIAMIDKRKQGRRTERGLVGEKTRTLRKRERTLRNNNLPALHRRLRRDPVDIWRNEERSSSQLLALL